MVDVVSIAIHEKLHVATQVWHYQPLPRGDRQLLGRVAVVGWLFDQIRLRCVTLQALCSRVFVVGGQCNYLARCRAEGGVATLYMVPPSRTPRRSCTVNSVSSHLQL